MMHLRWPLNLLTGVLSLIVVFTGGIGVGAALDPTARGLAALVGAAAAVGLIALVLLSILGDTGTLLRARRQRGGVGPAPISVPPAPGPAMTWLNGEPSDEEVATLPVLVLRVYPGPLLPGHGRFGWQADLMMDAGRLAEEEARELITFYANSLVDPPFQDS
jgi:hypothetical protein